MGKIKKCFKQVFNNFAHKLLLNYIINKAKALIDLCEYNINEIVQILRYKYTSGFTNIFLKSVGC